MRQRDRGHGPGRIAVDLTVMLADGGEAITEVAMLRDQPDLFGSEWADLWGRRGLQQPGVRSGSGVARSTCFSSSNRAAESPACTRDITVQMRSARSGSTLGASRVARRSSNLFPVKKGARILPLTLGVMSILDSVSVQLYAVASQFSRCIQL